MSTKRVHFNYYTAEVRNVSGNCKCKFTTSLHLLRYDDCYINIVEFQLLPSNKTELTKSSEGQLITNNIGMQLLIEKLKEKPQKNIQKIIQIY